MTDSHSLSSVNPRVIAHRAVWENCILPGDNEWTTWGDAAILIETAISAIEAAGYRFVRPCGAMHPSQFIPCKNDEGHDGAHFATNDLDDWYWDASHALLGGDPWRTPHGYVERTDGWTGCAACGAHFDHPLHSAATSEAVLDGR